MLSYEDLLSAYEWVSADSTFENTAYIDRSTGIIYWDTDAVESDVEIPNDIDDGTKYIAVPHKHDLDLGQALVFDFVQEFIPNEFDKVNGYFKRAGAYSKFKDLLGRQNILEQWHEYERKRTFEALHHWATENAIPHKFQLGANAA